MLLDLLHHHQKFSCGPIAAARLVELAGEGTAGCLLKKLFAGLMVGDALVGYSGLASATASEHLLTDTATSAWIIIAKRRLRR